jgi:argininosuccinate lyase
MKASEESCIRYYGVDLEIPMTLWGSRFSGKLNPDAWTLNASLPFDKRLALVDVTGSIAWASALYQAGVISQDEAESIIKSLHAIAGEFQNRVFAFSEGDEDIHSAVERRLSELIGPLAGKLHTGRSRNDQVATDLRLWLLEALPRLDHAISGLQGAIIARAEVDLPVIMPGYTHLQRAQPILLSHWWLSFFWPLQRDRQRLRDLRQRLAILPLGSGALAGTAFPIDRVALAAVLGFDAPSENSLDAVSDRDFAAEYLFACALTGVHLSRLAEAVVLFTSAEFGFFELSDAYATGSSLMPQKKNPDVFELARGKAGTLIGMLTGLLATLKGLPSAYDKDLQEDKVPVFTATDTLLQVLPVMAGALQTLDVNGERMRNAIDATMMATDLADYLVHRGLPFREAHTAAGRAVRLAAGKGLPLDQLTGDDWRSLGVFGPDLSSVFDPEVSIRKRSALGGTAPEAVQAQLDHAKALLD